MALDIFVNTCSLYGLVSDGTKPLPEPRLTNREWNLVALFQGNVMFTCNLKISVSKLCFKFTHLKSQPHLPGDNELNCEFDHDMRTQFAWCCECVQYFQLHYDIQNENFFSDYFHQLGDFEFQNPGRRCYYWNHLIGLTWIILCVSPANEKRRYFIKSSLIGWVHTHNDPWVSMKETQTPVCQQWSFVAFALTHWLLCSVLQLHYVAWVFCQLQLHSFYTGLLQTTIAFSTVLWADCLMFCLVWFRFWCDGVSLYLSYFQGHMKYIWRFALKDVTLVIFGRSLASEKKGQTYNIIRCNWI